MRKVFKAAALAVVFLSLFAGLANAQTYVNGNLGTSATSNNGTAAPAGAMWHELQHVSPTESNSTLGLGHVFLGASDFGLADDFTVPAGPSWALTSLRVYSLDQVTTTTTSPYTNIRVRIWNGIPGAGGTIVWGDMTTNVFAGTGYTSKRGIFNSLGSTAAPTPNLPIFYIDANVNTTLAPGTYWVEWQVVNSAACFSPTSQVVGIRSMPSYNARQRAVAVWSTPVDGGSPASAPDVNIELPFSINYTTGPCAGTPTPGNTITSAANVCPSTPFTLSLQNATNGSGVTYQWFSGPSATGPWTPIGGATNNTYTVPALTGTTFYQATVTCSGNTGTSAPVQVALNPPSACYCVPGPSDCTDGDVIENVTLGTLNNSSACSANGYANYTTNTAIPVPDVIIGAANPISVSVPTPFLLPERVAVWIDYNRNGQFEASEFTFIGSTAVAATLTANINVPSSVTPGITRMRVRCRWNTNIVGTDACTTFAFGETEDYNVNLVPCVPATITTQPTSASAVCGANASFTVAVAGSLPSVYWEYRTSATGTWLNVPNAAPYSGVNTNTLTISPATAGLNGYQYRAVYQGACTGVDFSNAATLTVTPYVANVTPTSATICNGSIQQLSITNTLGNVTVWTENFDVTAPIPTGWVRKNNSQPLGPQEWQQGGTDFNAYNGAATSYLMALWSSTTTTGSGTISNWLFTPQTSFKNGDQFKFYTRTATGSTWADRMEVRISTNGASTDVGTTATSVGDFTTVLLTINQTLVPTGYPQTWTEYTATVSGVTGTVSGRAAFRYFVTDGGGGSNSNIVGLDNVRFIQTGAIATGAWTGPAGTIFTDATATTPYVTGTPTSTVYVKPTAPGVNNYTVQVTTPSCVSPVVTIPVTARELPTSITAPANVTICEAGNTSFTGTPVGGSASGVQWQVSTDNGATFANVANGGVYTGATTNTLTITGAGANLNGYRYRLVASATPCTGTIASAAATLTINPLPVLNLTASPFTEIYPGQTTTLAVASTTTVPANGYTWYRNGVVIPGANGNTLVVDVDGLGTYTVEVSDANGCGNAVPATITIGSAANDIMFIYPSPNNGQFQIRYYSDLGVTAYPRLVNIYDSKGSRVYSRSYSINSPYTRLDVDATRLPKGIYSVELIDFNGNRIKTGRVLIQ